MPDVMSPIMIRFLLLELVVAARELVHREHRVVDGW
jgi:hypothetical protein